MSDMEVELEAAALVAQMTLEEKTGMLSGSAFWFTKAVARLGLERAMLCEKEALETMLQKKRASRARMERMDEHAWLLTQKTSTSGSIQGAGMGAGMRAAVDAPIS